MRMTKARVNLSIDAAVLHEVRELDFNLSQFVEEKLSERVRQSRAERWLEENREAIEAYNERIERDGPWNKDLISF